MVASPVLSYLLRSTEGYDEYISYMEDVACEHGIEFYDLIRKEYWEDTATLFLDDNHLNMYGAEAFSDIIAELVNGTVTKEQLLYSSVEERFSEMDLKFYGIRYVDMDANGINDTVCLITNSNERLEFEVSLVVSEEETILLQNFDTNEQIRLDENQAGTITVRYRDVISKKTSEIFY